MTARKARARLNEKGEALGSSAMLSTETPALRHSGHLQHRLNGLQRIPLQPVVYVNERRALVALRFADDGFAGFARHSAFKSSSSSAIKHYERKPTGHVQCVSRKETRTSSGEGINGAAILSDSWLRLAASAPLNLKLPTQECSVHQFVCSPVLSGIAVCLLKLIANLAILTWPATSPSNEHHTDPLTTPTRPRNF